MSESTGSTLASMAHASASEVSDIKHEHHGNNISAINLIDSPEQISLASAIRIVTSKFGIQPDLWESQPLSDSSGILSQEFG